MSEEDQSLPEPSHLKGSHACDLCERTFSTVRGLASHRKAHSRDTRCPICGKSVRYLGPHMRQDHGDDDLVQLEGLVHNVVEELRRWRLRKDD